MTHAPAHPSASTPPRQLDENTLIADIVDYPLELYARERMAVIQANPDASGMPVWFLLVLLLVVGGCGAALVISMQLTDLTLRTGIIVGAGLAMLITLIVAFSLRASNLGKLPQERMNELMTLDQRIKDKFTELGIKCHGCGAAYAETLAQGAKVHGFDLAKIVAGLRELNLDMNLVKPSDTNTKLPTSNPK